MQTGMPRVPMEAQRHGYMLADMPMLPCGGPGTMWPCKQYWPARANNWQCWDKESMQRGMQTDHQLATVRQGGHVNSYGQTTLL